MKGKFTSVYPAVVLVAITAGTIFFGYSKASGKITKSGAEEEQRYAWPLATCSTEDTITTHLRNTVCKRSREIK